MEDFSIISKLHLLIFFFLLIAYHQGLLMKSVCLKHAQNLGDCEGSLGCDVLDAGFGR